jgi:hypothetical protein
VNDSSACLYVDHQRTELTLYDGSVLTFPFAENNIPYMLTDWQPIVGIILQDHPMMSDQNSDQNSICISVAHEKNQKGTKGTITLASEIGLITFER